MLLPHLIALLKRDQTPELDGFFIVNLRVSHNAVGSSEGLHWRRFPGGQRGAVITHAFGDRLLRAVLLQPQEVAPTSGRSTARPSLVLESKESVEPQKMGLNELTAPLCFSQSQVEAFVRESGDENPNHWGESAVVPGLLMARRVEEVLTENGQIFDEFEFRFLEGVPLGQTIFLVRESSNRWVGRNEAGRRMFELSISGDYPPSVSGA